jgi:hypothetical protein
MHQNTSKRRAHVGAPLRERAKFFLRRHVYHRAIRLKKRSDDAYSTHLPILCALGANSQSKRVIEYGSGLISTPTFLNRSAFPRLESLLSFENDSSWYAAVVESIGYDARLELRLAEGPMKDAVAASDLVGSRLVFVDDSGEIGRAETIIAIAASRPIGIPIVIHDIEQWRLFQAAKRFDHMFRFDALSPQTGVAWNGHWDLAELLPRMNRRIQRHSEKISARSVEEWASIFRGFGVA